MNDDTWIIIRIWFHTFIISGSILWFTFLGWFLSPVIIGMLGGTYLSVIIKIMWNNMSID